MQEASLLCMITCLMISSGQQISVRLTESDKSTFPEKHSQQYVHNVKTRSLQHCLNSRQVIKFLATHAIINFLGVWLM